MTTRIKTGGRKRGSIDREERKVLTDLMAGDLMYCYAKLGGRSWLLEYAKNNPKEFIQFGLSRLWPAPQKSEDPEVVNNNTQINIDNLSELEIARRIAFVLAKATYSNPAIAPHVIDITPQEAPPEGYANPNMWTPPVEAPDMLPVDEDRARWASEIPLTPQERADQALVRETKQTSIETYRGGNSLEQSGHGMAQQPVGKDPRSGPRDRMLAARRRRDLL
ncbi:hypothetical protein [Pseudomonas izuensis]|uniref:hypothetical protein n=1 Tax=Pseudomonas izuensis TaxID=2684212 RepID=UPI00135C150D|nr:hypothetical protein [Pseudomonas izuensis]